MKCFQIETDLSSEQVFSRMTECLYEWWGTEAVMISSEPDSLKMSYEDRYHCDIQKTNQTLLIRYHAYREIHQKEWEKIMVKMLDCLTKPIPSYYIENRGTNLIIRKRHRRQDGKIRMVLDSEDSDGNSLTILEKDFPAVFKAIERVFKEQHQENLDYTSWNCLTKEDWQLIVADWNRSVPVDDEYYDFIRYVIKWSQTAFHQKNDIVIWGNL